MKFSKEWKIRPKTYFLVFALLVGNFSNKHHYNLLKILRIFCFWYFCLKWLFPKLFVLTVDLCITVVALIKITTVQRYMYFQNMGSFVLTGVLRCMMKGFAVWLMLCTSIVTYSWLNLDSVVNCNSWKSACNGLDHRWHNQVEERSKYASPSGIIIKFLGVFMGPIENFSQCIKKGGGGKRKKI